MEPQPDYSGAIAALALRFGIMVASLALVWRFLGPRLDRARTVTIFRALLLLLLYAAVTTIALDRFMTRWGFGGDNPKRGLHAMLEHRAELPFAYRVLTPELIARVSAWLGPHLAEERVDFILEETPLLRYKKRRERWDLEKAVAFHVGYVVLFAALLAALVAARALGAAVYRGPPLYVDFGPALAGLLLPLTFWRGGYLYDLPELLFLFLCVLCVVRERWWAFYPLFVLACFNKESNVLLAAYTVGFSIWRLPSRAWLPHAAAQVMIGAAIVVGLRVAFADSPGSGAWFFLPANLLYLMNPSTYLGTFEGFGPLVPFPLAFHAISLFLVGFALFWRFGDKPTGVRRTLAALAVTLLPLYIVFGFLDEVRALSIAFPVFYLAGFHTLRDLYDGFLRETPDVDAG